MDFGLILLLLIVIFAVVVVVRAVRIVPQQTSQIVERLGKYSRTLDPGIHLLVPFVDKVRANIDLREQVVSFPPQPVITSDNLVVNIDTVIYYAVTDAKDAVYEIANFIQGIEQLTVTTLRNVIGSMDLEQTLTSRDQINGQLRGVLDEATGKWGIRVNRVELKNIIPPREIQTAMERQMKAEREKRANILEAEGFRQAAILKAEGEKQSTILEAEGQKESAFRQAEARERLAEAEAKATQLVSDAIAGGNVQAINYFVAQKYIEAFKALAEAPNQKFVMMPMESAGIIGSIGGIAELAKEAMTKQASGKAVTRAEG